MIFSVSNKEQENNATNQFYFQVKLIIVKTVPALYSHIDQSEVETHSDQSNDGRMVKPHIGQTKSSPIENIVKIHLNKLFGK